MKVMAVKFSGSGSPELAFSCPGVKQRSSRVPATVVLNAPVPERGR